MMQNKINFIALGAGIATLVLSVVSMFIPWWKFMAGNPAIVQVNFSPVNFNLVVSGAPIYVPLVLALNIACLLTLLAAGIVLTIYSIKPAQPYSKRLLGFGYKKLLYVLVAFIAEIIAVPLIVQTFAGVSLPLFGTAAIRLSQQMAPQGSNLSVNVSAYFEWPFYLAIVVTGLSIAARFYHRKIASSQPPLSPQ